MFMVDLALLENKPLLIAWFVQVHDVKIFGDVGRVQQQSPNSDSHEVKLCRRSHASRKQDAQQGLAPTRFGQHRRNLQQRLAAKRARPTQVGLLAKSSPKGCSLTLSTLMQNLALEHEAEAGRLMNAQERSNPQCTLALVVPVGM